MKILKITLRGVLALAVILSLATYLFMKQRSFGKLPSGTHLELIRKSPNYKDGSFQNLEVTPVIAEDASYMSMMADFFSKGVDREPSTPIPSIKTDVRSLTANEPTIIWFGHSSYLILIDGKKILVDPVFSERVSPVQFAGVKRFRGTEVYSVQDFPELDAVIITHDHYDHLDYESIVALAPNVKSFYTTLGVGSHLRHWDIPESKITELDWWGHTTLWSHAELTCTPARHFSGRGLTRNKTLWGSYVLQVGDTKIFIGGDSGYDGSFKKIGDTFGPFDIALVECGQYNTQWRYIHMMPEQTVQASIDLQAKVLMPVHWGKFKLALHPWREPIERALAEAVKRGVTVTTPEIGEPILLNQPLPAAPWWTRQ